MTDGADEATPDSMTEPLQELVGWSGGLPTWIRDALRRLYQNGELNDGDIADLLAICKAQYGLLPQGEVAPAPGAHAGPDPSRFAEEVRGATSRGARQP